MRRSTFLPAIPCKAAIFFFLSVGMSGVAEAQQTKKVDTTATSKDIEQVVIVGYGKQKRTNLTSAVSTISAEQFQNKPEPNVALMLQGAAPGLLVTRTSGQPGSEGVNIQVRGVTSANGSVSPLYVIDGIVSTSTTFNALNPDDIQSISVLKDGGATAIYGAQSAGGVILVTTKTGRSGKARISFSSNTAMQHPTNLPRRLSLLGEMEYMNLAFENAGLTHPYTTTDLQNVKDGVQFTINPTNGFYNTYNTEQDFYKMTLRDYYPLYNNNLAISGGNQDVTYFVSLGNMKQDGIMRVGKDDFSRWNTRVNLTAKVNKFLTLALNSAYASQIFNKPVTAGRGLTGGADSVFYQLYRSRQRYPLLNPNGTFFTAGNSSFYGYSNMAAGGFDHEIRENFANNVRATVANFAKGLSFDIIYGRNNFTGTHNVFNRTVATYQGPNPSSVLLRNNPNNYSVTKYMNTSENFQSLINYDLTIGENHHFHILGGYQMQRERDTSLQGYTTNLYVNDNPSLGFTSDPKNETNSEAISSNAMQSFFGRFTYNFAGKYLVEATLRNDESSQLTPGDRTKTFPSFSAGWNITKEEWLNLPAFIDELKPRASWGKVGSQLGIGNYDFIQVLSTGSSLDLGGNKQTYVYPTSIPAVDLGWETVETKDIGLDFAFIKNRLTGSFDYYIKTNKNMLVPVSLPATIGLSVPLINGGKLRTHGWEVQLNYNDKIGQDFSYSITANLADSQNKLLSYTTTNNVINAGVTGLLLGFPINSIWAYKADGYFQNQDQLNSAPSYSQIKNKQGVPGLGDIRYVDIDGSGRLDQGKSTLEDHGDLVNLGDTAPRYQFSLNLQAKYKDLDFSIFLQGIGKRRFMPNAEFLSPAAQSWTLPMAYQSDYWTPDNPNAAFPRPYYQGSQNFIPSSHWFMNGAYVRAKNIQLGYSLPADALNNMPISRFRIYLSGENIFTISALPKAFKNVIDPESPQGAYGAYPFTKTYSLGVNIDF